MDMSGISVVVPTRGRSALVARLLKSLESAARMYDGEVEVLILDDSEEDEMQQIRASVATHGFATCLPGDPSVRRKRNHGIERARYDVVLFVDSDCEVTPELFREHARMYAESNGDLGGVVGVTEFVGRDSAMWAVIQRTQFLNAFSFARRMQTVPWATCTNTSYKTALLRELGGFDTSFPARLGGDDVDLGLRVNAAGYKLYSNPSAVVFHTRETWNSFHAVLSRAFRWGRMDLHLYYRKHSDRITASMPRFGTLFLLLLLVSLAQALLLRRPAFLLLPWVWALFVLTLQAFATVRQSGEKWTHFFHELIADVLGLAFEAGTMIEGLRYFDIAPLFHTVRRGPVLPVFENHEWRTQQWSMLLALLLLTAVIPFLV
jgi:cellulose synthase/poly-beta-1,6-N-acetylglucosamine synthase-like glycosyltransferase